MADIRILYFGGLRDALGLAEESLVVPSDVATVGDLRVHLAARHPLYAESRGCVRVARNEAFAEDEEKLSDGDVIAMMPPFAGG